MPAQPPSPPPRTPAADTPTPKPGQTGYVPSASGAGEEDPGASIDIDRQNQNRRTAQDAKDGDQSSPAKP